MNNFEIIVKPKPSERQKMIDVLFELGASAIEEVDLETLKTYLPIEKNREEIENQIRPLSPNILIQKHELQNWENHWKQFFKPTRLGKKFYLIPFEENTKWPKESIPLWIEPGQAFGTGTHESTQLCIEWIEKLIPFVPNTMALDLGTGTGILSIVLEKLGVSKILALDTDELAIEATQINTQRNRCKNILAQCSTIDLIEDSFNLIVSNILLETHLNLMQEYFKKLKGPLILSGLLSGQENDIETALNKHSISSIQWKQKNEWVSCLINGF